MNQHPFSNLQNLFANLNPMSNHMTKYGYPEIQETENDISVTFEFPSFDENDVSVTLSEDNVLSVSAEMTTETETGKDLPVELSESNYKYEASHKFSNKNIQLPATITPESIETTYKNGVLTVKAQKASLE